MNLIMIVQAFAKNIATIKFALIGAIIIVVITILARVIPVVDIALVLLDSSRID